MKLNIDLKRLPWGSLAVLLLTLMVAVAWIYPWDYIDDDLAYLFIVQPTDTLFDYMYCEGDPIRDFGDAVESCVNHWIYTYGRLADKLVIMSALLPLRVCNILCALSIALQTFLVALCAGRWRNPAVMALAAILLWTIMPWYDMFSQRSFIVNYVVSTCVILAFIYCWRTARGGAWAFVAAFIAGMIQEAFGAAVLVWLVTDVLCNGYDRRKVRLGAVFLVGFVCMMLSPGTWQRFFEQGVLNNPEYSYWAILRSHLTRYAVIMLPITVTVTLAVIAFVKKKLEWRRELPWLALIGTSVSMMLYFVCSGRYLWLGYLGSVILLLRIAASISFRLRLPRGVRAALWVAGAIIYCLWGLELYSWQSSVSMVEAEMRARLTASDGMIVEAPLPDKYDIPWYVAGFVNVYEGRSEGFSQTLGQSMHRQGYAIYAPPGYGDKPLEEWPKVPGANNLYGSNGIYYMPAECGKPTMMLTFGDFTPSSSPADHFFCALRGNNLPEGRHTHQALYYCKEVGEIKGRKVKAVYLGDVPRGLSGRRIERIDSIAE